MSTTDAEYQAVSRVVKADRRFRVFQYALTILFLLISVGFIWEMRNRFELLEAKVTEAIEQIKIQNEETRRFDTCLLLVPIGERTPERQRQCFDEIDKPGGIERDGFETSPPTTQSERAEPAVNPNQVSDSYSNSTPVQSQPSVINDTPLPDQDNTPPQENEPGLVQSVINGVDGLVEGVVGSVTNLIVR